MRERPILFSGEMVRAILDGRKTQTRRIIHNRLFLCLDPELSEDLPNLLAGCPYGQSGDRLWVRETMWVSECGKYFAVPRYDEGGYPTAYYVLAQDRSGVWRSTSWSNKGRVKKNGKSTGEFSLGWHTANDSYEGAEFRHRRPSIFMPRWASRLTLEVTAVRVERLRDITDSDARAEGVAKLYRTPRWLDGEARRQFETLWDGINGKRAPWSTDPWVWVVTFSPVPNPIAVLETEKPALSQFVTALHLTGKAEK